GAAGRGVRGDRARGNLPGPAALPALRRPQPGAARVRGPGDPPRLALRDGERDRARRRDQLVACAEAPATRGGGATRTGVAPRGARAQRSRDVSAPPSTRSPAPPPFAS